MESTFVYSLNSGEIISFDQDKPNNSYQQVIILANEAFSQINQNDLINLKNIFIKINFQQITFDGVSYDLSKFITQELLDILYNLSFLNTINIYAKSDEKGLFLSTTKPTTQNITVEYFGFKLFKSQNSIDILINYADNIEYCIICLQKICETSTSASLKINNHQKLSNQNKIALFQRIFDIFQDFPDIKIYLTKELEYIKRNQYLYFNSNYLILKEFNSLLTNLQLKQVKTVIEQTYEKEKQSYDISQFIIFIKELNKNIQQMTINIDKDAQFIILDQKIKDLDIYFELNLKNNQQISYSSINNKAFIKSIKSAKTTIDLIHYFLSTKEHQLRKLRIINCYDIIQDNDFNLQVILNCPSFEIWNHKNYYLILNEKKFCFQFRKIEYYRLINLLKNLKSCQSDQFDRLELKKDELFMTVTVEMIQDLLKLGVNYVKFIDGIEYSPNFLKLNNQCPFQKPEILQILSDFHNLQKIDFTIREHEDILNDIFDKLPKNMEQIKINFTKSYQQPKIYLDQLNFKINSIHFSYLDKLKSFELSKQINDVEINCDCTLLVKNWSEQIVKLQSIKNLKIGINHYQNCQCNQLGFFEQEDLQEKVEFLSSIEQYINTQNVRYMINDYLKVNLKSFEKNFTLIQKLKYQNLDVTLQTFQQLETLIQYLKTKQIQSKLKCLNITLVKTKEQVLQNINIQELDNITELFKIDEGSSCISTFNFKNSILKFQSKLQIYNNIKQFNNILFGVKNFNQSDLSTFIQKLDHKNSTLFIQPEGHDQLNLFLDEIQKYEIKTSLMSRYCETQSYNEYKIILNKLVSLVNQGTLQSFKLDGYQDVQYSNRQLSFILKQGKEKKLDNHQQQQLDVILDTLKNLTNIKRLSIQLKISELTCKNAIDIIDTSKNTTIQNIYFRNIQIYNQQISQSNFQTNQLQQFFFLKKIMIRLCCLMKMLSNVGLNRPEKIEEYLQFFKCQQSMVKQSYFSEFDNSDLRKFNSFQYI